jgi:hypothetical protein
MPGKTPSSAVYSAVSAPKLYRTVSAADASLADVPSLQLDMTERLSAKGAPIPISIGADNKLKIGVLLGAGVTSVEMVAYVDMAPVDEELVEDPAWTGNYAEVQRTTYTKSGVMDLDGIYPGALRVLVATFAGAGNVYLSYSRTE